MPNKDGGFPLPDVIDPPRISVCVPVPDDPWHRRAFMGTLYILTYWWSWARDPDRRGREAAAVWLEIWQEVSEQLDAGEECGTGGEDMTQLENMLKDLKSELRLLSYDGTPASINPDAPTVTFNQNAYTDTDATVKLRDIALCLAVRRYVYELLSIVIERGAVALGIGAPGVLALLAAGPIAFVVGAVAAAIAAYLLQEVIDAAEDQDALDEVVCDLYKALRNRSNSAASMDAAVQSLSDGSGNRAVIVFVLKQFSSKQQNYLMMLDGLAAGYTAAQAGAENDCCPEDPTCSGYIAFEGQSMPFGVAYGNWTPGSGIYPTNISGSSRVVFWLYEWEEACPFPAGPNRLRAKMTSVPAPTRAYQFWVKRADTGVWTSVGQIGLISGTGWDSARPMGVYGDNNILGIGISIYQASGDPVGNTYLRGFWWGSDVSGTPPF